MSQVFTVHFVSGSYKLTTQGKKQKFMRIIARSHGFNNGSGLHLDQLIVTGILRNLTWHIAQSYWHIVHSCACLKDSIMT